MQITILLIVAFLSNGQVAAQTVNAPDMETCLAAKGSIAEAISKTKVGDISIKYVDTSCHTAVEGKNA